MSVICFTSEQLQKPRDTILSMIEDHNELKSCLIKSKVFKDKYYLKTRLSTEGNSLTEDKLLAETICRLFWYLHICNRVAYSLQYKDQPKIDYDSPLYDCEPEKYEHFSAHELLVEVYRIGYNLSTIDGHSLLNEEWTEIFENMVNCLQFIVFQKK